MSHSDRKAAQDPMLNAEELLIVLTHQLEPRLKENTAIVGIHSGGVWLMERILTILQEKIKQYSIEHGTLDVSFYRDDYAQRGLKAETHPSQIPFDVEGKHILLIDDVFYTGRTTRAAMNELFDYGRPASITLAALVDRGGRELPIAPQIVAASAQLQPDQHLQLIKTVDGQLALELN